LKTKIEISLNVSAYLLLVGEQTTKSSSRANWQPTQTTSNAPFYLTLKLQRYVELYYIIYKTKCPYGARLRTESTMHDSLKQISIYILFKHR